MGMLQVRKLDDELIARLKARAERNGRSAEAEHREILRDALTAEDNTDFFERAARFREKLKGRKITPTIELLREAREGR